MVIKGGILLIAIGYAPRERKATKAEAVVAKQRRQRRPAVRGHGAAPAPLRAIRRPERLWTYDSVLFRLLSNRLRYSFCLCVWSMARLPGRNGAPDAKTLHLGEVSMQNRIVILMSSSPTEKRGDFQAHYHPYYQLNHILG